MQHSLPSKNNEEDYYIHHYRTVDNRPVGASSPNEIEYKDWLVPIPGLGKYGFYWSPVEPVDPYDCQRFPNSPFCSIDGALDVGAGGIKDALKKRPTLLDLGVDFSENEAEIVLSIEPSFFWTPLPPLDIAYRKPEYRPNVGDPNAPTNSLPGEIPNGGLPFNFNPYAFPEKAYQEVLVEFTLCGWMRGSYPKTRLAGAIDLSNATVIKPPEEYISKWDITPAAFPVGNNHYFRKSDYHINYYTFNDQPYGQPYWVTPDSGFLGAYPEFQPAYYPNGNYLSTIRYQGVDWRAETFKLAFFYRYGIGQWGEIGSRWEDIGYAGYSTLEEALSAQGTSLDQWLIFVMQVSTPEGMEKLSWNPVQLASAPPLPPIPPEEPNMGCCAETNELLRLLLQKIGADDLPATVSTSLIQKGDEPDETMQIESLADLTAWIAKNFAELMGQWEIPIEIEDNDPLTAGNQKQTIRLPNLAEAIAELFGLAFNSNLQTSLILNTTIRTLQEAGHTKQQALLAHLYSRANAEFLGYEASEKQIEIGMAFTPGEEDFARFLQESTQKMKGWENTDSADLRTYLTDLLQAAAIIRAVYGERVNSGGNLTQQIIDLVKSQSSILDDDTASDGSGQTNWEKWKELVELGFNKPDSAGQPYGRDFDERPKIREFGSGDNRDI